MCGVYGQTAAQKAIMFEGREISGKVRLIQIAGDTYSSHLSGHERLRPAWFQEGTRMGTWSLDLLPVEHTCFRKEKVSIHKIFTCSSSHGSNGRPGNNAIHLLFGLFASLASARQHVLSSVTSDRRPVKAIPHQGQSGSYSRMPV